MKEIKLNLILAFLYFSTGVLCFYFLPKDSVASLGLFAPEGIALGFVLFYGVRVVGGVFLGQLIFALYQHLDILSSLEISLINSIEEVIAYFLLTKLNFDKSLNRFEDFVKLIVVILFVLQPFSAFFSAIALLSNNVITKNEFFSTIYRWWFGNITGDIIFSLIVLSFLNTKNISLKNFLISFFYLLYLILLFFVVKNVLLLLILVLIPSFYLLDKFGKSITPFLTLTIVILSMLSVYFNIGAFTFQNMYDNTLNFNLFIIVSTIVIMMASIIIEKEKNINKKISQEIQNALEKNRQQELELYKKNRYKLLSEFISLIAHHWRQPLNNISLLSQMVVLNYKKDKLNDEFIDYFRKNIIEEVNDVSKKIDVFKSYVSEDNENIFEIKKTFNDLIELFFPVYNALNKNVILLCKDENIFVKGKKNDFMLVILTILEILIKTKKKDIKIECIKKDDKIILDFNTDLKIFDNEDYELKIVKYLIEKELFGTIDETQGLKIILKEHYE